MQSASSPSVPAVPVERAHAGAKRPATEPLPSALPDQVQVTVRGRQWQISPLVDEQKLVRACCVCQDALACRSLCDADIGHRVCAPCQQRILHGDQPRCPLCRSTPLPAQSLAVRDSTLNALARQVSVQCAECHSWSGAPEEIDEHISRCGEQEHPCVHREQGCTWTGPMADLGLHAGRCPWTLVACSLPDCQERVPRREKEEHEEFCIHRPATRGALNTTLHTLWRLDSLQAFCQQNALSIEAVPETVLKAQMQEAAFLLPMLCEVLERTGPPVHGDSSASDGSEIACPWGCGFIERQELMSAHYPHCGYFPVACGLCFEEHPRRELAAHRRTQCVNRPAVCPRGCGQPNLREQDISSGLHFRLCSQVLRSCVHCRTEVPAGELAAHQTTCDKRLVDCSWCLGVHRLCPDFQEGSHCRSQISCHLVCGEQRLRLHERANGAVYVAQDGADDPVFIRFPTVIMARELGARATGGNLTRALGFVWNGVNCQIQTHYMAADKAFRLRVTSSVPFAMGLCARIRLWNRGGTLLEQPGSINGDRGGYRPGVMAFHEQATADAFLLAVNAVTCLEDEAVFLQLGPVFRPGQDTAAGQTGLTGLPQGEPHPEPA